MAKRRRKSRRRRNPAATYANPRRKSRRRKNPRRSAYGKRRRNGRRRRNPAGGGTVRTLMQAGLPAVGAGLAMGFIDRKFLSDKSAIIRTLAKVAGAFGASILLRKNPPAAFAAMGAMIGSSGYDIGAGFATPSLPKSNTPAQQALIVRRNGMNALVTGNGRTINMPSLQAMQVPSPFPYRPRTVGPDLG